MHIAHETLTNAHCLLIQNTMSEYGNFKKQIGIDVNELKAKLKVHTKCSINTLLPIGTSKHLIF